MKTMSLSRPSAVVLPLFTRVVARRVFNLVVSLVPLLALLAGSCETMPFSQMQVKMAGNSEPAQLRTALFPDRADFHGARYMPAAGYVSRARDYIEESPQAMMMLTRQEIGYIFGKPALRRRDADADVWQYKAGTCVVDFYFYGDGLLSFVDARLKDEATDGRSFRKEPISTQEKSGCLRDIVSSDDFSGTET